MLFVSLVAKRKERNMGKGESFAVNQRAPSARAFDSIIRAQNALKISPGGGENEVNPTCGLHEGWLVDGAAGRK